MSNVQILGLLRFSYPSIYNDLGKEDFAAYQRELYEPKRLERRLCWFEHLVVPCLRAQTDPEFTCLLLMGDQLPEPFRGRILDMISDVPQIVPCFEPEGLLHRKAVKNLMARFVDPKAETVAEFQLDDDDAVAVDLMEQIRAHYPMIRDLRGPDWRFTLDFCAGIMLRMDANSHDAKPIRARFWTPALVTYRRPQGMTTLRIINHLQLWRHMSSLIKPAPFMFIRGAHETNISGIKNRWGKFEAEGEVEDMDALFKTRFNVDVDMMQAARTKVG